VIYPARVAETADPGVHAGANYRRWAAWTAVLDLSWWLGTVAWHQASAPSGSHLDVPVFIVSLVLRVGLNVLGLRFRWAIAIGTIVRVVSVVTGIRHIVEGRDLLTTVVLGPLLLLAIGLGVRCLFYDRSARDLTPA
jgi:hypothetical protein